MRGRVNSVRAALSVAGLTLAALTGSAEAQRSSAAAPGDAHRGKALAYTCLGCHGIESYKNAYPMYSVPRLEGQSPEYLAAALHGYRDGDRAHFTMHSEAAALSDQDILDLAAYLAGKPLVPTGHPGGPVPPAATLCVSCHGQDGVAIAPTYPSLAGQHEDYLARALEEYAHGGRNNPVMKGFAATLKDDEIAVITQYFAGLRPGLAAEPRANTRLSAH